MFRNLCSACSLCGLGNNTKVLHGSASVSFKSMAPNHELLATQEFDNKFERYYMTWRGIKSLFRRFIGKVVDAVFIFKSPFGLQKIIIIIHGASCSGKSTVMRRLKRRYNGFKFVEADNFQYTVREEKKTYSAMLEKVLKLLIDRGADRGKATSLVESIQDFASLPGLLNPPYKTMAGLVKECLENDVVIATCGNLPPPHWNGDYYRLLASCTGKGVLHVLIAPDNTTYMKRVRSRYLDAKMEKLLTTNSWRLENKQEYQLVLTGCEKTKMIVAMIHASARDVGTELHASI
jgi:hypothetical protein